MLPPEESPIHRLIGPFQRKDPTSPAIRRLITHAFARCLVWAAAAEECQLNTEAGTLYNPSDDCRVKWLLDWCDVLEGKRHRIDRSLTASMEFLCPGVSPRPLSGKDLAAGAGAELETLAQGS